MGCFTSSFYSFVNRPWESKGNLSYSVRTPISKIVAEIRGSRIMRILPYVDANEWILDHCRIQKRELVSINPEMCCELNVKSRKVITETLNRNEADLLLNYSFLYVFFFISHYLNPKKISLIMNSYVDLKGSHSTRSLDILSSFVKINKYWLSA